MIISSGQVQNLLKTYSKLMKRPGSAAVNEVMPAKSKDNVVISGEAKLMQRALQAVRQAEDIRQDKVDQIRQAVTAGTYEVSPDQVAEKMIYRALVDKLV